LKAIIKISLFSFESRDVRILQIDGDPWFVGADVCEALGIGNSRDAISRLDEDEKNTVALTDGNRGNPNHTIISEPGLYALIGSSKKEEAKRFKRWVNHEVLPQIRKTGFPGGSLAGLFVLPQAPLSPKQSQRRFAPWIHLTVKTRRRLK
jgi:prophage antirepressor-like protein